ncbi:MULTISPECIES: WhiB family transcriptional regulator [unclassified Microbacterium]|uniref:WhiB family transcriptional regulator n=1 Tax=unclassified Microbacterium TaxID=2609290 RepID=UPI0015FF88A9|nr:MULTISPECIES: WhiB family transcriptional regulator [unclassified Microbacterium]MBT2485725.1 WhiB family transcriptional regulator [Microbacterium sp. ISL-108]
MIQEERWLTYRQAAERVRSVERTIRRWHQDGMVMGWQVIGGQRTRVVREDVLLAWWRDRMDSSPVHQLRLRKRLEAAGVAYVPPSRPPMPKPEPQLEPVDEDASDRWPPLAPFHEPLDHMKPMAGRDEYAQLMKATRHTPTRCRDVDEFTAERLDASQLRRLEAICATCPVLALCGAYAVAAQPAAGFWAGRPADKTPMSAAVAMV